MLEYLETFGDDLDGNRGVVQKMYEIEPSDFPLIKEQVLDALKEMTITINLIDSLGDKIEFEVEPLEYLQCR